MATFVPAVLGSRQSPTVGPTTTTTTDDLPHDDLGPRLNAVFWSLTSLSLVFMCTRLYCKYLRGRYLWWDDYVLVASWIALAVSAATTTVCVALDYGKHGYDIRPENLPEMPFVAVFAGFFSVLSATWSKTSFALTLIRLSERWMRLMIWGIIVTLNAIMGTAMLFMWVKCTPFAKIWDVEIEGTCIPPAKVIVLYQWSAGMFCRWRIRSTLFLTMDRRVLWRHGCCPCALSLGDAVEAEHDEAGKVWCCHLHEHGRCVSFPILIRGEHATDRVCSAGLASFVKLAMLPHLAGDPGTLHWLPLLYNTRCKKRANRGTSRHRGRHHLGRSRGLHHHHRRIDPRPSHLDNEKRKHPPGGTQSDRRAETTAAGELRSLGEVAAVARVTSLAPLGEVGF